MTRQTFENRTKGVSKNSKGYKLAEMILTGHSNNGFDTKIRTCWTSGKGRFTSNLDYTEDTVKVLKMAGLKMWRDFVANNDSPKGGLTGNYIQLTSLGKRKMIK